ncbi:MAG: hypothetical protein CNLJKLNK_00614 [Holosporales bacterium]
MKQLTKAYVIIALLCFAQVHASCDSSSLSTSPEGLTPSAGVSPSTLVPLLGTSEIPDFALGEASYQLPFKQSFSRSQTCPDFGTYEKTNVVSRQVSPPPERVSNLETPAAVHVRQDSDAADESAASSRSSSARSENGSADLEDLLTLFALAYEGYKVPAPEKFTPPYQAPIDFLTSKGYEKKIITTHYAVFENTTNKTTTISFAGTNTSNMHIAMGSCLFWQPSQYDAVGRALFPGFISAIAKKPYTMFMNATIATSLISSMTTMFYWAKGCDILLPGLIASTSLVFSAIMWKNIGPWLFLPVYLKHIHSIAQEIKPIYRESLKKGYNVSFVGHSLGGHFAQIFTAIFANTNAHCISAPGGGYLQLSIVHGWYQSIYGQKDDLPGKSDLPGKEEWDARVRLYACDGDPIINLRHKNDAIHNKLETHEGFGFQEGVDLHRIKNIYIMYYAIFCEYLVGKNRKKYEQ